MAEEGKAGERLSEDPTAAGLTVEDFIKKIVSQCREVLDRHDKLTIEEYLVDGVYRTLEVEMVEVKVGNIKWSYFYLQGEGFLFCASR